MKRRSRFLPWFVLSTGIHVGVLSLIPGERFELAGRGLEPAAEDGPSASSSPSFASLDPIEVIEVAETSREDAVEQEAEPASEREPVESEDAPETAAESALSAEEMIERLSRASPSGVRSGLQTPTPTVGGGGEGGGYVEPAVQALRWPEYPDGAPDSDRPIRVVVRVYVTRTGVVRDVELVEPSESDVLNGKALEWARATRFAPARRDGRPVGAWTTLPIEFNPQR